jgi:UDP-glucose 4-epimerase
VRNITKGIKKIFIAGATGFIGSTLSRRLKQKGFELGITKRENSDTWRIKDLIDEVEVFDVNIRDHKKVSDAISSFKPDAIFNLATHYSVDHQPQEISLMFDTNVLGTLNLLEVSKDSCVKLFVNTSSCFVYKGSKNKLKEDDELSPVNLYALTKIHAEQACSFYAAKYGLKTVTFRLFPPYGPADHERRLIPYVIMSLLSGKRPKLTSGEQRWDFVYVEDIIDAFLKLLSIDVLPRNHEVFNIGTGDAVSIREVVSRIVEIMCSELEPEWGTLSHRNSEVWFTCADTTKTEATLGWRSKTRILGEGIERTINWYENFLNLGR